MARMPTRRPRRRHSAVSAFTSVDLPLPGGPVTPTTCAPCLDAGDLIRLGGFEVVLRSRTHNPALMSLAFGSGLRARIRLNGDAVVVTVGVESLKPLPGPARSGTAAPGPAT